MTSVTKETLALSQSVRTRLNPQHSVTLAIVLSVASRASKFQLTSFSPTVPTKLKQHLQPWSVKAHTTLVISPSGATESATNPEYTITNAMLENFTPINSTVGELATVTATFTGGTWVRDIT
jgi:hypothetical protein